MRPSRKPRFVLILLLALCALFVYGYTVRMDELAELQAQSDGVLAKIARAEQDNRKYQGELAYVTSLDYADEAARTDFDYARGGEVLVVPVYTDQGTGSLVTGGMALQDTIAQADPPGVFDPHDLPVWQQWVAFFASDGRARR